MTGVMTSWVIYGISSRGGMGVQGRPINVKLDARCFMVIVGGGTKRAKQGEVLNL